MSTTYKAPAELPPRKPKPKNFNPAVKFAKGHRYAGKKRCKAWAGRQGRQCLKLAMKGRQVCSTHGGKSLRGKDAPAYKHGGTTKDIIDSKIGARFASMLADEKLLSLKNSVALGHVRVSELVDELDEGGAPAISSIRTIYEDMIEATKNNDAPALSKAIQALGAAINKESNREKTWGKIFKVQDYIRRQTVTEKRLLEGSGAMVPAAIVIQLAQVLALEIRQLLQLRISDKNLRQSLIIEAGERIRGVLE